MEGACRPILLPMIEFKPIDGRGSRLRSDAASSYLRMLIAGCPPGVTSALRTYEEQVSLFTQRYRRAQGLSDRGPFGDVRSWKGVRWVRTSASGPVNPPGTSLHETGTALDLPDKGPREWVRAYGANYGWNFSVGDSIGEPWHAQYYPLRDKTRNDPPLEVEKPPVPTPIISEDKELEMRDRIDAVYLACTGRFCDQNGYATWGRKIAVEGLSYALLEKALRESEEGKHFSGLSSIEQIKKIGSARRAW